jgi:hypothetical protein
MNAAKLAVEVYREVVLGRSLFSPAIALESLAVVSKLLDRSC